MYSVRNFSVSWGIAKLNWNMANPFNFTENAFRNWVFVLMLVHIPKGHFFPAKINSQLDAKDVDEMGI